MGMRRFFLDGITMIDIPDGPSAQGVRCFAQGVHFTDGSVAIRPLHSPDPGQTEVQTGLYSSLAALREAFPAATVRWWDKVCFACGSTADRNSGPGFCVQCGASWDEPVDEMNRSLGRWTPSILLNGEA